MCQLLGMNCNTPTDIVFSFTGFHKRGGITDHHADGWGISFFEGKGVRTFLDEKPSSESDIAKLVTTYPIKSCNVIAHIRKATQGVVSLANTHPFVRELWGRYWVFAHNGNLKDFPFPKTLYFQAVGETDSEQAFCYLLECLRTRFDEMPSFEDAFAVIKEATRTLRNYGPFNFMLSEGTHLLAHCSTHLHYIERKAPFSDAHLIDEDVSVDFGKHTSPQDKVAVIATQALTDNEVWMALAANEFAVFHEGARLM